jgi:hypothetical protein
MTTPGSWCGLEKTPAFTSYSKYHPPIFGAAEEETNQADDIQLHTNLTAENRRALIFYRKSHN